ncbi:hypothetical protein CKN86_03435 [Carnobacterium divergens]|uniref:hypothetical protein n=1 Tax=Carnobacterium divergens TaxID=2748 RepID=UPI000D4D4B59|nr:hypothetical protein [Carnobacterium divergens]MCO6018867.1 hypothetical protein [Carnobacterium divergens]TFI63814.1 hypothetical protein CKN62_03470 [Carnobacterium divergens]TFI90977.1 hypothetical protein CKN84_03470 [Carnobacterium divergens]TFJ05844.1 hypothetical protein CKN86_03435 [Carnobacterium divergens]TFJ07492.1 hypothetical protein CKN65_03475 [Carnobacterium divergens]
MRIYVQINLVEIALNYRELAEKMWFSCYNHKKLELSHMGNTETLQEDFSLSLKWDKWLNDDRWTSRLTASNHEHISVDPIRNNTMLYFETDHVNILTVDKRALYIMVCELAKEVQGTISDDNEENWLTLEEFKEKHQEILNLTFEEANEISLKEVETMTPIDEPEENEVDYS